jgi:transcription initiation factor TFIIIB Brf1 subunit/transcription initiation factor TFIIB
MELKDIPEKSKQFVSRIKEDWKTLSPKEKAGVVAVAIIINPVVAGVVADFIGRRKLKTVI